MRFRIGLVSMLAIGIVGCNGGGGEETAPEGWVAQSSVATVNLADVSFVDANTGAVVGDNGTILRTTDGGATWVLQNSGTTAALTGVSLVDESTGTVVGVDGVILRTTDRGVTWVPQDSGIARTLMAVAFIDANTGFTVGAEGTILRTTNGGAAWVPQISGVASTLLGVSFVDASTGTVVGFDETILRTTDGGVTWVPQSSDAFALADVTMTDASTAIAVGSRIVRTTDGGATWRTQFDPQAYRAFLVGVSFGDAQTGSAVGDCGNIFRTNDGGETWAPQDSGVASTLVGVSFSDSRTGTAVGFRGTILRTTDGGGGPGTGRICGSGGSGGSGGTGGSGGLGGSGGTMEGACTNPDDTNVYTNLSYLSSRGVTESGSDAASAIGTDCVFGSQVSDPQNPGCSQEAQAVLICGGTNCDDETIQALADCVVACTQSLIEEITGEMLSTECADCYGESVACSIVNCATAGCTVPTSPSCVACQCENDCTPGFDRCSGLPPSGECP